MATLRLALRVKAALLLLLFPAEDDDDEEGEEAARCVVVWKLLDISISPNNDDNNKLK
jgi:hypothetical protein